MIRELNKALGKIVCFITKTHRRQVVKNHVWKVDFCNRCGHIFEKEKIGRTFLEIYNDVYNNSGNQIW